MDTDRHWIVRLAEATPVDHDRVGGKAATLARLAQAGYRVSPGFCITTAAYERFLDASRLNDIIRMELGRKPFESMRWEEIWDTALRIRSAFVAAPIPTALAEAIAAGYQSLGDDTTVAVRSSAPREDTTQTSFAGLHASLVDVRGVSALLDAVRLVWASLWSDAALLYRHELALDVARSRMAVLVQTMVHDDRSGVAFGRDPRQPAHDLAIIESVPGPCGDLVDGVVDPDRWLLQRSSGIVLQWQPGDRSQGPQASPLLDVKDLDVLWRTLQRIETLCGWSPDLEWTGRQHHLTVLQARPITTARPEADETRAWYLTLRPGARRLKALCHRVVDELIPQLQSEGERFAAESLAPYDDARLADAIAARLAAVQTWKRIYHDDFIPFAHGVRQLALYYNDAVRPPDPYEFVGLLHGQTMLAAQRNQSLADLSQRLRTNPPLLQALQQYVDQVAGSRPGERPTLRPEAIRSVPGGDAFWREFKTLLDQFMDVAYGGERLADRADVLLRIVIELAQITESRPVAARPDVPNHSAVQELEQRLFTAVGPQRLEEAREALMIGRLSWRLRDDDNLLVGRLESQLLRALHVACERLRQTGRLHGDGKPSETSAPRIIEALRDADHRPVALPSEVLADAVAAPTVIGQRVRQLIGQPAAPGLAAGIVRRVRGPQDLGGFRAGEVLVCDAIQPTMTHLVPLASAVVERRGGMLIHGSIIARELGIPCVNGIAHVVDLLADGDVVTVDGHLGIVTVGAPEFDLERRASHT